jgi:hypothetical protein
MILAGHQPNYLPWLGFFDKMKKCDTFIIEDNVQFVHQEFQNRNRIKNPQGIKWLTVPIKRSSKYLPILDVQIADDTQSNWGRKHWLTLEHNYKRAPYWDKYSEFFRQTYDQPWTRLIDLNLHLIQGIMKFLNIKKPLVFASSLGVSGKKNDLIIQQCKALGANILLSGEGGRNYLDLPRFREQGIKVVFQGFEYPVYPQLWGKFVPNLSIVDYLFCTGSSFQNSS